MRPRSSSRRGWPVIALAIMLPAVLAGGAVVALGRYLGWGTDRLAPARHAFGELGFRLRSLTRRA